MITYSRKAYIIKHSQSNYIVQKDNKALIFGTLKQAKQHFKDWDDPKDWVVLVVKEAFI